MRKTSSEQGDFKLKVHTYFDSHDNTTPCNVIKHRLPGAPILEHLKYSVGVSEVLCDPE